MSQLEVDKIIPQSGTTLTIGDSGDTITIPSGVTLNTLGTLSSLTVAGNVSIDGGTIKLDGNLDNNGNVALGNNTLASGSFTGNFNTAIGSVSLTNTTSGDNNVGIGSNSLQNNTTGSNNIAIGKNALDSSQTNSNVIAIGTDTLERNTTDNNVGIGYQALRFNTTGNSNTGVGYHALQNNISGSALTAFGQQALDGNTTGLGNTAVGYQALTNNTTTDHNTALGYSAGSTVTTGSNLTLLGSDAEPSSATATNEVTLGDTNVTIVRNQGSILFPQSGRGIYLGTTTATASNLLDDYEEGTWTPTASQGSVSHVAGGYIKIGRLVTLTIDLSNFTNTTSTDFIQINGIPFAVDSSENMATGAMFGERIDTNNNGNSVQAVLTTSSTGILFFNGVGSTNFAQLKYTDINDGTDCAIRGTITYLAAS